jgi:hypothetical protein
MSKAIVINVNGEVELKQLDGLQSLQDAVGGYIEGIYFPRFANCTGLVNEEGKLDKLPLNIIGTAVYILGSSEDISILNKFINKSLSQEDLFDVIVGNMIINGPTDEEGESTDIPEKVILLVNLIAEYVKSNKILSVQDLQFLQDIFNTVNLQSTF